MNLRTHHISRFSIGSLLSATAILAMAVPATTLAVAPPEASGTGVITGTNGNSVNIELANGSTLSATLPDAAMTYAGDQGEINPCEGITLTYHQDAGGAVLDSFTPTGITTSSAIPVDGGGTCATQSNGGLDVIGKIIRISKTGVTISASGRTFSFPLDPTNLVGGGTRRGDIVDLTFDPSAQNLATNIQTTEAYVTGTVTRVSTRSLTLSTPSGGRMTFAVGMGAFSRIHKRQRVGVLYWVNAGVPQADVVTDFSSGITN
jgi:hypothetical protein